MRGSAGAAKAGLLVTKAARAAAVSWLALMSTGCTEAPPPEKDPALEATAKSASGKATVLVTLSPIADIVRNVAGDDMRVLAIVAPDVDPHSFSPTPADAKKMVDARAIFRVGHGIDDWLGDMARNAGENTVVLDVTRGQTLDASAGETHGGSEHSHDGDAHIWMDPLRVLAVVETVCAELQKLQPQSAKTFRRRADAYKEKLRALDAWTKERVALVPPARRKLVTSHDELGYFARRYGFEIVGVAVAGGGTDENGANARDIAALIDKIRVTRVPAIFADTSASASLMKRLGDETGVRVVRGLRIDALGKTGTPQGDYLGLFRENVNIIVGALR